MSGQNKNSKKINFSKLPPKVRKKLQKHDKRLFPLQLSSKAMEELKADSKKLTIKIECYRCTNKFAKLCKECGRPICGVCETHKPKGYCVPCRNKLEREYLSKGLKKVYETLRSI